MHADPELSAFLDGELAPAERARVEAHLGACERCSRRLAELRSASALIRALPASRPRRSLVPAVTPRFVWLRPVRSLSAVASGAFLFVFLLTAVARSGSGLGGGETTTTAARPAASAASAPFAASTQLATAAASPVPAVAPAPGGVQNDAAQRANASPAPSVVFGPAKVAESTGAAPPVAVQPEIPRDLRDAREARSAEPGPLLDPRLWLVLAAVAAAIAVFAHARLRRA